MAASDIASLGFKVETASLKKGENALKKLGKEGKSTEKKIKKTEGAFKSFGKNAAAAVAVADGPLGGISSRISSLTTVVSTGGLAMTAFALAVTAMSFAVVKGVRELDSLQVSLARSNALIRATGGAAGKTGEQLASQAQEIAFNTLASVEGISKAQGIMLTFKNISGAVFDDAIRLSQDLASVMGGDAASSALQFGKALNDPIKGMTSLSRAGIAFTQTQKDMVKGFIDSGQMLKAQAVILDEVKGQLQGVAKEIASTTLSGSLDTIGQSFDNLTVRMASNINALDTFKSIIDRMSRGIQKTTALLADDTAAQAFEKALDLQWEILEVESKLSKLRSSAILDRAQHKEKIKQLQDERQAYVDYAKTASEAENKIITARGDAILAALELAEVNRKAAKAAKALEDAKPFEKWKKSIEEFQSPAEKMTAELIRINEALASGSVDLTSGTIGKITALSEGLAKLNTMAETDTSYQDWIDKITDESTIGKLQALQEEVIDVWMAMDAGEIDTKTGLDYIDQMEDKIKSLQKTLSGADMFGMIGDSAKEGLSAVQSLSEQGSKEYKKMGIAIQAVSAVQAIFAVLNQASGDPYTAFARMASMAGAVASLGFSVGGLSGGFTDTSAQRQDSQGLNVWGEKSGSVNNAIESTASATDKLVGINTGMLNALQAMQQGIAGAASISTRGGLLEGADVSGEIIDFNKFLIDPLEKIGLGFLGDFVGKAIGKLLGGSSSVADQGIGFGGGNLGSMRENADVFAFSEVQFKKWKFGSTKTKELIDSMGEASVQFALVFDSMANAVFEGATDLGLGGAQVESAINSFNIASQKISLKGLSAEDQQAEIEAVFSSIFDDLAGSTVSWIHQFQMVGEGLGETLSRVATQVSIAEVLMNSLGVTLTDKMADPFVFAKIADNISVMVGGIELFASKTASFIDNFAPETVKFDIAADSLAKSLKAVGLAVPDSADAMFELMNSLSGTSQLGQKQIAALLNAQDVATDYYKLLEDREGEKLEKLQAAQQAEKAALDAFNNSLMSLTKSLRATVESIYGISGASAKNSLDSAIAAAKVGDFSKAMGLNTGSFALDQSDFSSKSAFDIAQGEMTNKLLELASLTGEQATTEDMILTEAQKQTELLTVISGGYTPQTGDQKNVILLEEVRMLRAEMKRGNDNQETAAGDAKKSADSLQRIEIGGLEVRA